MNKRITKSEAENDGTIGKEILDKTFSVSLHTGLMRSSLVFTEDDASSNIATKNLPIRFKEIDYHVVRSALNTLSSYNFERLKGLYPQLKSTKEFVTSDNYLANLRINITGAKGVLKDYSQSEKYVIAKTVLKEIESLLISRGKTFKGTHEFHPVQIKDTFRESITLNVTIPAGGTQEFGVSMRTPRNPQYTLDLSKVNWYAYNDNFGTSEEKALVKYIEGIMPKLEEKYDEIYLVRNEKDVKIYSFDTGQVFEPDFVLFLRVKESGDKYDNLQLFIEPKGDGLLKQDKWKNDFLKQIKSMAEISWCTKADNFFVWGVPFFNENNNKEFEDAINDEVLTYTPALAPGSIASFIVIPASEVPTGNRYTRFIPLFSVRAACGSFEDTNTIPEEEAEGWVDVSEAGIKANKNMFLVHAVGESMKPRINDGDLCVFELYGAEASGSREGEIVLTKCINNDDDYGCSFTIKKYHSERLQNEDGSWQHTKVELLSLNPEFSTIEVSPEDASSLRTIGILKAVL